MMQVIINVTLHLVCCSQFEVFHFAKQCDGIILRFEGYILEPVKCKGWVQHSCYNVDAVSKGVNIAKLLRLLYPNTDENTQEALAEGLVECSHHGPEESEFLRCTCKLAVQGQHGRDNQANCRVLSPCVISVAS